MITLEKLERWVWLAFLLFLPLQVRYVYSPTWYFNEYTSYAVYFTDVLLLVLLGLWIFSGRITLHRPSLTTVLLLLFGAIAGISIIQASQEGIAWYRWGKLVEGIILWFYIRNRAFDVAHARSMLKALLLGAVPNLSIAIMQYLRQADLGLQFLGESVLSPDLRGIASFYNNQNEKVIRAYGLMPHPNVLATYILAILSGWYLLSKAYRMRVILIGYTSTLLALCMTFSRTAILAWGGTMSWLSIRYRERMSMFMVASLLTLLIFGGVFYGDVVGRFTLVQSDEAVTLRSYYNERAIGSGDGINWLGLGIGNFVPWLMERHPELIRDLHQPAHNIFLLVYAELGILGLALLMAFLISLTVSFWRSVNGLGRELGILWIATLLFIGTFDHFFWTLQQGIFIFWGILGMIAHYSKSRYT